MKKYIFYLTMLFSASAAHSKDIYIGETYPIVEPNPIIEIKNKLKNEKPIIQAKIDKYRAESLKKLEKLKNTFEIDLPEAKKDSIWKIDTSFTLDYNVPDGKGGILYPKGYKYDPKDYMKLSKNIVVLDGSSKEQIVWAKKHDIFRNKYFKILITGGKIVEIMRDVHTPIYFYTKEIHKRFKLKHTPTIIRQEADNALYAYEFKINDKEKK